MNARKTRNYKKKSPMVSFGQIALPIAALVAVGILVVGVRLFLLSPDHRDGGGDVLPTPAPEVVSSPSPAAPSSPPPAPSHVPSPTRTAPAHPQGDVIAVPVDPESTPAKSRPVPASPIPTRRPRPTAPAPSPRPSRVSPTPLPAPSTAPAPSAPASPQPTVASSQKGWVIQVGAFSKREAADALLGTLRGTGYAAVLSEADVAGRHWFRVRIPVSGERGTADALAAKLRGQNLPAQVFPGAP